MQSWIGDFLDRLTPTCGRVAVVVRLLIDSSTFRGWVGETVTDHQGKLSDKVFICSCRDSSQRMPVSLRAWE